VIEKVAQESGQSVGQLKNWLQKCPEYVEYTMGFAKDDTMLFLDKPFGDQPYTACFVLNGTATDDGHWKIGIKTIIDNHKKVIMCIFVAECVSEEGLPVNLSVYLFWLELIERLIFGFFFFRFLLLQLVLTRQMFCFGLIIDQHQKTYSYLFCFHSGAYTIFFI
jgi:hypothetical protein